MSTIHRIAHYPYRRVRIGSQHIDLANDLAKAVERAKKENERQEKNEERRQMRKASFIGLCMDMRYYDKLDKSIERIWENMRALPGGGEVFRSSLKNAIDDRATYSVEMASRYENSRALAVMGKAAQTLKAMTDWFSFSKQANLAIIMGVSAFASSTILISFAVPFIVHNAIPTWIIIGTMAAAVIASMMLPFGVRKGLEGIRKALKRIQASWKKAEGVFSALTPPSLEEKIAKLQRRYDGFRLPDAAAPPAPSSPRAPELSGVRN